MALASILLCGAVSGCGQQSPKPVPNHTNGTVEVVNFTPHRITVRPWHGATPLAVDCQRTAILSLAQAPPPPWSVTVNDDSNGVLLLSRTLSAKAGQAIVVRLSGTSVGPADGAFGPAPPPCS